MYRPMRVWWLLFLPPYECVVFTVFTALRECGGYYIYRLLRLFIYHSIYTLCVVLPLLSNRCWFACCCATGRGRLNGGLLLVISYF